MPGLLLHRAPISSPLQPHPGPTGVSRDRTETRRAQMTTRLARPFLLSLRLASRGCSCPNAPERPGTFLFVSLIHMLTKAERLRKTPAQPSPAPLPWLACPPRARPLICLPKGVHKSSFQSPPGLARPPWTSVTSRWKQLKTTWQKKR